MRLPGDDDQNLRIDLLPAIDVIFAILALTIVASATLSQIDGLPVVLPRASSADPQSLPDMTVTIGATGELQLDGVAIELDGLVATITQGEPQREPRRVILRADERVPHGQVVAVLDRLRQVEGIELAIGVEPRREP
ncbi:MAG: biopolymer transporter ExbD [Coleofasciculaceae cyanobacterium RL_1_1]|nr:biopolymer transporter ExbD [Coleofasciculaceae cyanobacterium RL_1_1]